MHSARQLLVNSWSRSVLHAAMMAAGLISHSHAQTNSTKSMGDVQVISTMPLPGMEINATQAPFSTKTETGQALRASQANSLTEFLDNRVQGIQVNNFQGNPFLADVNYRGYTASPSLGNAPGLSVFLDGMRINEPFGDVVRWDQVPLNAIHAVNVLPGTLPQFGLNSLGGALVLESRSGLNFKGVEAGVEVGSFGRVKADLAAGGRNEAKTLDYFFAVNAFDERGWRDFSPSNVGQLFGKLGINAGGGRTTLSVTANNSRLNGNGTVPLSIYDTSRSAVYTHPDTTKNQAASLNLTHTRLLAQQAELSVQTYLRTSRTKALNGDVNEISDLRLGTLSKPFDELPVEQCANVLADNAALTAADASGTIESCSASLNRSDLRQTTLGMAFQLGNIVMGNNTIATGLNLETSRIRFRQTYQLGDFTGDRGVTPVGPSVETVNIQGRNHSAGLYLQDTLALTEKASLLLAGRYNLIQVSTNDRLASPLLQVNSDTDPIGSATAGQSLNNNFRYTRFNPSASFSYQFAEQGTWFVSAGTNNRAPTPVELACADPNFPCLLPNAMASDPYLKQVVSTSMEAGFRQAWMLGEVKLSTSATVYRSENNDDILFVSSGTRSAGYFKNFGKTRRQGIELGLTADKGPLRFSVGYNLLDATYQSSDIFQSASNSSAADLGTGNANQIQVKPGDKIPGFARHSVKALLQFSPGKSYSVYTELQAQSDQFVRGNENNQHQADATHAGGGKTAGFAVVNMGGQYKLTDNVSLVARVSNLFDRRYFSGGVLGENKFPGGTLGGANGMTDTNATFYAPGAPRAGWLGVRFTM